MKLRYKVLPLALTLIALCIGYVIAHPLEFGFCQRIYTTESYIGCLDRTIIYLGHPIFSFALRILPVMALLLFVSKHVFNSWVKFALWAIPLFVIIFLNAPDTGNQTFQMFQMDAWIMARYLGWLFLIISLLLIAFKTLRTPKN